MKTKEEILDKLVYERSNCDSFPEFIKCATIGSIENLVNDAMDYFAIEVAKQTLENIASKSQEMIYSRKVITRDILNEPIVLNQHCYAVPKQTILNENNIPEL